MKKIVSLCAMTTVLAMAAADTTAEEFTDLADSIAQSGLKVGELRQHIEAGYVGTSGNSDSQTLNALYGNDYQWTEAIDLHFRTDALYDKSDGEVTNERYRAYGIGNYHFSPVWYAYTEVGVLRNTFEGYNQQYNAGAGIGYVIVNTKKQLAKVRGGYQYRHANFTDGTQEDFNYLKIGANYDYRFNENNTLTSEWNFLEDLESAKDYETVFRIALKNKIVGALSLKVGFEVKYDNTPALNDDGTEKKKTDTTTTVGIVYDF